MPSLSKTEISERIGAALGTSLQSHGPFEDYPFLVQIQGAVPLAIFPFTVTSPPGGRDARELKVQLIAPGQQRGDRGNFVAPPGHWAVLLGYSEHFDLFVLWEAQKHRDFGWSKNCQVRMQVLGEARISGIATMDRTLQGGITETIIAARPDHLAEALRQRIGP